MYVHGSFQPYLIAIAEVMSRNSSDFNIRHSIILQKEVGARLSLTKSLASRNNAIFGLIRVLVKMEKNTVDLIEITLSGK